MSESRLICFSRVSWGVDGVLFSATEVVPIREILLFRVNYVEYSCVLSFKQERPRHCPVMESIDHHRSSEITDYKSSVINREIWPQKLWGLLDRVRAVSKAAPRGPE